MSRRAGCCGCGSGIQHLWPTVGRVDMPNIGDELHHFGWKLAALVSVPYMPHPHTERRYLVVPGIKSSRIHILG